MALEDENSNTADQDSERVTPPVAEEEKMGVSDAVPQGGTVDPNEEDPFMRALGIARNDYVNPIEPPADVGFGVNGAPVEMPPPMLADAVATDNQDATEYESFSEMKSGFAEHGDDVLQQPVEFTPSAAQAEETALSSGTPASGTITVNGTLYAVSVFWQPLQNPDNALPEIRDAIANVLPDSNLYVLHTTGMPQYGLGLSSQGHKAGMPVAALAASDVFQDLASAVAVFKVPEGWWFLAIRNGLILAEEDVLYSNEEDAKRNFLSMMAVPDWGRRIAPASWDIEGVEEVSIDTLFATAPKVKLLKLKKELSIKTVAIVVGAIVLLGIGIFALLSRVFNTTEVIQEVVAPPPVIKPVVEEPKIVKMPMPWESLVVPSEFVKACSNFASVLTSSTIPGWMIGDIRCQSSGLSTTWSMQWGRVGNFLSVMDKYKIDGLHYTVAKGGRSATGTIHFNQLRKAASNPDMTVQEITDELTDMFQAIAVPVQLSITDVRPNVVAAGNSRSARQKARKVPNKQEVQDAYSYVNFSFSSPLPVSEWSYFFDKFAALELTSLLYNKTSNNWKYEGRIYGKNK